jgi:hypothetical protein
VPTTPAHGVEDGVEVDDPQRRLLRYHAQQHEDVGHQDGGEQFQEVLDPEVDHPEPPEVADREGGLRAAGQPHRVEERDRQGAVEEQVGEVAPVLARQTATEGAEQDDDP